jgi:hypothetical protein
MLTIDPTRAERAREIFAAALSKPVEIETPENAAQWRALEAERERDPFAGLWAGSGVKHSNAPHKQSAYAHLPMRGICSGSASQAQEKQRAIALWPELSIGGRRKEMPTLVKKSSPHPDSYGTSFPLRGMGLEGENPVRKWTLTASEKRELDARPLRYTQAAA